MKRSVNVCRDDVATVSDVMQLISRLPYIDFQEFAETIGCDADQIATAVNDYIKSEYEERAES